MWIFYPFWVVDAVRNHEWTYDLMIEWQFEKELWDPEDVFEYGPYLFKEYISLLKDRVSIKIANTPTNIVESFRLRHKKIMDKWGEINWL